MRLGRQPIRGSPTPRPPGRGRRPRRIPAPGRGGGGGAEGDVSRGTGEFLTDLDGREREEAVRILSDLQAGERRAAAAAGEAAAEAGEGAGGRAPPRGTRSPRRAATARERRDRQGRPHAAPRAPPF